MKIYTVEDMAGGLPAAGQEITKEVYDYYFNDWAPSPFPDGFMNQIPWTADELGPLFPAFQNIGSRYYFFGLVHGSYTK